MHARTGGAIGYSEARNPLEGIRQVQAFVL